MRERLILLIAALAVALGGIYFLSGSSETHTSKAQAEEKQVAVTDPKTGELKQLPLVDGGDPAHPASGQESNADPRTPVVQDGTLTRTWGELDTLLGKNAEYTNCVDKTIETDWKRDIPKFKATEAEGNGTRFLLVVNSPLDDNAVRRQAKADGVKDADTLPVLRAEQIVNTRGFDDGKPGCEEFVDRRPQIRESLGVPVYDATGKPVGLKNDRGNFVDCHNPWYIPKEKPRSTPSKPGSTTPTSPPTGGGCEDGCVTTTPPRGCPPGSTKPECLEPKNPNEGAAARGNVPTQVQGTAPPATKEPRPPDPPPAYTPPPPPPPPATTPRPEPPPPPPPDPEPTEPFDPCEEDPGHPACG